MARQNYQVLARRWRPQQFADVVGQQAVVRTLANALDQQRIAHAYCFSGIRGVGKTTIARLLARGLNCRAGDMATSTPCGECESCLEVMGSRALDVFERDAASDRGINEMKELIEIARYAPSRDRYKVMILDEAHMLTTEASNALLKVLEEPPEYIVFVLATTEPNKILPTILSRCQHYQFARISQREISAHLARIAQAEGIDISSDGLALIAEAADGSLRDAQSLLDKLIAFAGDHIEESTVVDLLGLVDRMLLYRSTDLVAAGDVAGVLALVNEMVEQGVDLHQFAIDLLGHFRNLLVVHSVADPGAILHLPAADIDRLRKQAEQFEVDDLDRAFSLIASNEYRIKVAEQPRYHVEVVLSRLARMPSLEPIRSLIEAVSSPSGGRDDSGPGGTSTGRGAARGATAASSHTAAPSQETRPLPTEAPLSAAPTTTIVVPTKAPAPRPPSAPGPAPAPAAVAAPPPEEQPPPPPEPDAPPTSTHDLPDTPVEPLPVAATGDHADLLGELQRLLEASHPLVAQVLGRASGIDLDEHAVTLRFPSSAGIFAERVRDPQVLPALSAACSTVAGRPVKAQVELDEGDPRAAASAAGDAGGGATDAGVGATPDDPAKAQTPGARSANGVRPPTDDVQGASGELLERAESEPLVQDLLRELKGQVISVEEG